MIIFLFHSSLTTFHSGFEFFFILLYEGLCFFYRFPIGWLQSNNFEIWCMRFHKWLKVPSAQGRIVRIFSDLNLICFWVPCCHTLSHFETTLIESLFMCDTVTRSSNISVWGSLHGFNWHFCHIWISFWQFAFQIYSHLIVLGASEMEGIWISIWCFTYFVRNFTWFRMIRESKYVKSKFICRWCRSRVLRCITFMYSNKKILCLWL